MRATGSDPVVVDEAYLRRKLRLPENFIEKYSRAMGRLRCRPHRYLLKRVIGFLERQADESALKGAETKRTKKQRFHRQGHK